MTDALVAALPDDTRTLIRQIAREHSGWDVYEIAFHLDEAHGVHANPRAVHAVLHDQA
jgi:hypothetical protein